MGMNKVAEAYKIVADSLRLKGEAKTEMSGNELAIVYDNLASMAKRLEIAEKALEQFTRGKFYRSIENDTWSHMVHMEKAPWEIADKALQQIRE